MSLRLLPKTIRNTIGFRIAAGYSFLAALNFLALVLIAYLFLSSTLALRDRDQVRVELEGLRTQYLDGGLAAFTTAVKRNDSYRKNNPFFTRIVDNLGNTITIFFPQRWQEFNLERLSRMPVGLPGDWCVLPANRGDFALEVATTKLPDGFRFQVGISTEDRQRVLAGFRETVLLITVPLLLLSLAAGAFLAHRSLRPVRHLIQTVTLIHAGRLDTRVPRGHNGDELDELGRLFNEMIERIDQLIRGMNDALDAVAHELRTPMTHFRNLAERALKGEQNLSEYREALQGSVEESDRIIGMLNMLMDISEAETGTLHLKWQSIDLSALAVSVAEMYQYVAEEKGIVLRTEIEPHVVLQLDPDRMSQVVANLLDNAVKYTPAGGWVTLSVRTEPGAVLLLVADSGMGVEPDETERIWERLYRGQRVTQKGIGLGLSLVRAIVQAHGGEATVNNRSGGGALFGVRLPLPQGDGPPV